jgi:ABC-type microcin C transport system permease subunit YejE
MVLSRKLVTAVLTNFLTDAVGLVVARYSLHLSVAEATQISAVIGVVAGALAGFIVKEVPDL